MIRSHDTESSSNRLIVTVACIKSVNEQFDRVDMMSHHYTKQQPKLSELSCEHSPSFYELLGCIQRHIVSFQHTELYEQYSVYDGVDDGQYRASSGDMSVINVESLIRKTCSPHEDIVSASKNPDPRKRSIGHDASTIGHISPKLMRSFVPAM